MTKKDILSAKEYYTIVAGIVFILLGCMWISFNIIPTSDSARILLGLGILFVLVGIGIEAKIGQDVKRKFNNLERRINDLEKNFERS